MSDVCQELQNIKYQTMLLNHNSKIYEAKPNIDNIEAFLEKEKEANKTKPWSKLSKASKLKKISEYVVEYSKQKNLTKKQTDELQGYLTQCLNRKKLQRQKDVTYDISTNKIKSINGLHFNKNTNKFTLKIKDKKTSTLKSLPPKKNKTQHKNGKKRRRKKSKIDSNLKE
jgi:hypothetical protein|tara:strand:- start:1877 stop:2386 length:510 start_codon:yes stop_codon:yes gene_type:complete